MFENRSPVYFCKFKNGKVEKYCGKDGDGKRIVELYDFVIGKVSDIDLHESTYNNEELKQWQVILKDNDATAILTLSYSSSFTRSFFNALAAADLTKPIKFGCYLQNDFNCPSLRQNGDIIRWKYQEMPKTERVKIGSKEVINDEKAVKWTQELINEIKGKLLFVPEIVNEGAPMPEYKVWKLSYDKIFMNPHQVEVKKAEEGEPPEDSLPF
jgi:hypothetical protein